MGIDKFEKHYEESVVIASNPTSIFSYADNHNNFSSHMNKSSWMMMGGKMTTKLDDGKGQKVGSHIKMSGKILGINLFLDEVIIKYDPPFHKEWQTVGKLNLLVIDNYALGFNIKPDGTSSMLKVYINYNLPKTFKAGVIGLVFGKMYAKWCVKQMINSIKRHFEGR